MAIGCEFQNSVHFRKLPFRLHIPLMNTGFADGLRRRSCVVFSILWLDLEKTSRISACDLLALAKNCSYCNDWGPFCQACEIWSGAFREMSHLREPEGKQHEKKIPCCWLLILTISQCVTLSSLLLGLVMTMESSYAQLQKFIDAVRLKRPKLDKVRLLLHNFCSALPS